MKTNSVALPRVIRWNYIMIKTMPASVALQNPGVILRAYMLCRSTCLDFNLFERTLQTMERSPGKGSSVGITTKPSGVALRRVILRHYMSTHSVSPIPVIWRHYSKNKCIRLSAERPHSVGHPEGLHWLSRVTLNNSFEAWPTWLKKIIKRYPAFNC